MTVRDEEQILRALHDLGVAGSRARAAAPLIVELSKEYGADQSSLNIFVEQSTTNLTINILNRLEKKESSALNEQVKKVASDIVVGLVSSGLFLLVVFIVEHSLSKFFSSPTKDQLVARKAQALVASIFPDIEATISARLICDYSLTSLLDETFLSQNLGAIDSLS